MKHKTWFRLVIKAIGVLLIGFSFPYIVVAIYEITSAWSQYRSMSFSGATADWFDYFILPLLSSAGTLLMLGFGLYLFFGGEWVVNRCIPSNRPYCPECGYDLSKSEEGERCPECGVGLAGRVVVNKDLGANADNS